MSKEIICSDCGEPATIAVVFDTSSDRATPYCVRCLNANNAVEQNIADFEMRNFGGYYGVPSHHEYPIETFKWYRRGDGRFQAAL